MIGRTAFVVDSSFWGIHLGEMLKKMFGSSNVKAQYDETNRYIVAVKLKNSSGLSRDAIYFRRTATGTSTGTSAYIGACWFNDLSGRVENPSSPAIQSDNIAYSTVNREFLSSDVTKLGIIEIEDEMGNSGYLGINNGTVVIVTTSQTTPAVGLLHATNQNQGYSKSTDKLYSSILAFITSVGTVIAKNIIATDSTFKYAVKYNNKVYYPFGGFAITED